MIRTRLTDLLDIEHPVMLAGMGGVSYHRLVAAVSDAGGIGTLGASTMRADELPVEMAKVRDLTAKPFGVEIGFGSWLLAASVPTLAAMLLLPLLLYKVIGPEVTATPEAPAAARKVELALR